MSEETPLAVTPAADTTPAPEPTTEPVDLTTKIEEAETESPPEAKPDLATEAKSDEPDAEDGDEPKKNIPGSQRLKRRLQLIESEFQAALRENEELKRRVPQEQPQNPQGRPGIDREPTEADFPNDYFAFERAKTAFEVRQSVRDEIARAQHVPQQMRQAEQQRERLLAYEESAEQARERIPDFDKVVRSATDVVLKNEVIEELLASEKSALLQYHLANNRDKARELNGMSGKELAREIGRLESRIHLPKPKQATAATPPPAEIRGGASAEFDPFKTDDMNAYAAWRKKQQAAKG